MIGTYYIYLSDQRRPKWDHLKKNNLLKEAILIQWDFTLLVHETLLEGNKFLHTDIIFAIFCKNSNNTYNKQPTKRKERDCPI